MNSTLYFIVHTSTLGRVVVLGIVGFILSMIITPIYTSLAYRYKWWKKPRETTVTGQPATVFQSLHAEKHRRLIPTMAGIIFVISVLIVTFVANLQRNQTWLPLAGLVGAAAVGLADDIINFHGTGKGKAGLPTMLKLFLITAIAFIGGWWFYFKLGVSQIHVPFVASDFHVGWVIIPIFVLAVVSTANAVNITDGLDGLAGGLASTAFGTYTIIAALEGRFALAGFCLAVVGALLSYTWFNIYPARFMMGDVGSFALGTALGVVAMQTNTVVLLPIIGFVFVADAGSVILQLTSKKLRHGKKLFKISPIHHHFEASGWPEAKVTMRFWVIGQVAAVAGLVLFLLGKYF